MHIPVAEALGKLGLNPVAILATHHHADHVGGLCELTSTIPGVRVIGSLHDQARVPGLNHPVSDNEELRLLYEADQEDRRTRRLEGMTPSQYRELRAQDRPSE